MSKAFDIDMDDMNSNSTPPRRFVDRQIPIGVIVVLLLNLAAGIWYASATAKTIQIHSEHLTDIDNHNKDVEQRMSDMKSDLAVLKFQAKDSMDTAHRIEDYLHSQHR